MTQKIRPCLWFDHRAEEATNFYVSCFKNATVQAVNRYGKDSFGPEGTVLATNFVLDGQEFIAVNGGPAFSFTPAISFFVRCTNEGEIDALWEKLSAGGTVFMPLDRYPFSERFGWVGDRFGVSWQLIVSNEQPGISPYLLFTGEQFGRAEEALERYVSIFEHSRITHIQRRGAGEDEREGTLLQGRAVLDGREVIAMESGLGHDFTFTPAVSFSIDCRTQEEVDRLWEALTDGGEESQCAWLIDRFGVSWQVVPAILLEMLQDDDPIKANRVMNAMRKMKKIDIAALESAYEGK